MDHPTIWWLVVASAALLACSSDDPASPSATGWMTVPAPTGGAGAAAPVVPMTLPAITPVPAAPPAAGIGAGVPMGGAATAGAAAPEVPACATGTQDSDADGSPDCDDGCPQDLAKTEPGACGCGVPEPTLAGGTCGADDPGARLPDPDQCVVHPITDELREQHGDVYTRYASANGVPVLATDSPQEEAMRRACTMLLDLGARPEIHDTMIEEGIGLVVMGEDETSADFPEFAAWGVPDSRARGLGGVPRGLCAEENVMCDTSFDRWRGESICLHEFAHTMHLGVYGVMDDTFDARVDAAYRDAMDAGLFANTYAASNAVEYFAEGAQDWYNTNLESARPNGVHNQINTREELKTYDPGLYALLAEVLPDEPSYRDCYFYE